MPIIADSPRPSGNGSDRCQSGFHHPRGHLFTHSLPRRLAYVFDGVVRKYRPDFLVRLKTGTTLVLEVKGLDSPQNQAKRAALHEWIHAVTEHGGFGRWTWGVSKSPSDILDVVAAAART